jgi:hypothetical protein
MIIRILSSCSKRAFIIADNRRRSTDHGLQAVHSSQPSFLNFNWCFLSLPGTNRKIIKK